MYETLRILSMLLGVPSPGGTPFFKDSVGSTKPVFKDDEALCIVAHETLISFQPCFFYKLSHLSTPMTAIASFLVTWQNTSARNTRCWIFTVEWQRGTRASCASRLPAL